MTGDSVIRTRAASATAVLLLVWAALVVVPVAAAQTPSPSPSSSGSVAPSTGGSSVTPQPQRASLALLVSAEPRTIELGEDALLVVQVTNTGGDAVDAAAVEVTLPRQLDFVESFPRPWASTGSTHSFVLGPLEPGASSVVQITARGNEVVPEAVVSATATAGSATASDTTGVAVVVTGEGGGGTGSLTVESRASRVLAQVGSMVHYDVTVANDGTEDLENVLVVDVAPEEVDVVSVDIVDEVEAVQIGESDGRHDIVWNVGSLPAGASVVLPWDGLAARPGDLTAVNSVRGLLGQTETVRSTSRSFLAREGARDVENPPFDPIEERVVTFVDPPPGPGSGTTPAPLQPTTVLPSTGAEAGDFLAAALLFVLSGVLLMAGSRLASGSSARALAAAMIAGVLLGACVAGDDPAGDGRAAPRTFGTDDPRAEDAQVKGERIVRGEEDEDDSTPAPTAPSTPAPPATAPPAATATPTAPPPATAPAVVAAPTAPPATAPPAVDPEPVRVVEIIRIGLEDLPVETLGSRGGDNTVSFGWEEGTGVTAATSGTRFVRGNGSELLTDLTSGHGKITNRITLTNTHDAARLHVDGRILHEVYSDGRLVARLRSAPYDEVLAPGGSVVARFSYLVPTGDYVVQASFEASQ